MPNPKDTGMWRGRTANSRRKILASWVGCTTGFRAEADVLVYVCIYIYI